MTEENTYDYQDSRVTTPIFYFLQYLMDELRRGQRVRASLSNWYQEQVEPEC